MVLAAVFGVNFATAQDTPPANKPAAPHGKVLFSRDQDSPEVKVPEDKEKPLVNQAAVEVSDAERTSLTFTSYDLDVHVTPAESKLAVHATFSVKNSGKEPFEEACFSDLLSFELGELWRTGRWTCRSPFLHAACDRHGRRSYGEGDGGGCFVATTTATRWESDGQWVLFRRGSAIGGTT